ncbi:MAG: hypothetical protein ACPGCR_02720, partial [Acholeplasmataceae bacterium]
MRRLTIGFFIDTFYPMLDGVVKVTDHQARMLAKDHDVYVFAPKAKDASYVDDFPYHVKRVLNVYVPTTDYQLAIPPLDRKLNKEEVKNLIKRFNKVLDEVFKNNILTLEEEVLSCVYTEYLKEVECLKFTHWGHDKQN